MSAFDVYCYTLRVNVGESAAGRLCVEGPYMYRKYGMLVCQASEPGDVLVHINQHHRPGQSVEALLPAAIYKTRKSLSRMDRACSSLAPTVLEVSGIEVGPLETEWEQRERPYDWSVDDRGGLGDMPRKVDLTERLLSYELQNI